MSELQELCERLTSIGISTGHADDFESLARECVDNIAELTTRNKWLVEKSSPWIAVETGKGPKERGEYLVMCGDKTKFIFVTRGGGDVLKEKREEQTTIDGVFHPITHYTPIPELPVKPQEPRALT